MDSDLATEIKGLDLTGDQRCCSERRILNGRLLGDVTSTLR